MSITRKQKDNGKRAFLHSQLVAAETIFFQLLSRPATKARISTLMTQGLQERGDFELRLGQYLGAE